MINFKKLFFRIWSYWIRPIFSYSVYVLLLLCLINIIRTAQRGFLSIVARGVQRDLKITDDLFGLINGPIFSVFFSISGLVFGRIMDISSRKICIVIMLCIISLATSAHAVMTRPVDLAFVRISFAIGISGMTAVSVSLISDFFTERRTLAVGVWNLTAYLGAGSSFAMGSLVNTSVSNWREIFMYFGLPTALLIIPVVFTLFEPAKVSISPSYQERVDRSSLVTSTMQASSKTINSLPDGDFNSEETENSSFSAGLNDESSQIQPSNDTASVNDRNSFSSGVPTLFESSKYLLTNISLWCICIFAGSSYAVINAQQVWLPLFFERVYGIGPPELALYLSWITPVAGTIGSVVGGILGDKLPPLNKRWYPALLLISVASVLILQSGVFLIPNLDTTMTLIFPLTFFTLLGIPVLYVVTVAIVPSTMTALSVSWMNLFLSLIGSLGPLSVGLLNQQFQADQTFIRWSLFIVTTVALTISSLVAMLMFCIIPQDFRRLKEWNQKNSGRLQR